jgi:hypothetical protein
MKKLTYKEVKNFVESKNCELISKEYDGAYVKIDVLCDLKKHIFPVTFSNFKHRNSRCPDCESDRISARCKTPYDKVVEKATKNNLKLLTSKEEYQKNHKKKLRIRLECLDCKHPVKTTVGLLNTGVGCKECKDRASGIKRRNSYEKVKKAIEKAGYELLSTEYVGNKEPLKLKCKEHGVFFKDFNSICGDHGCTDCGYEKFAKARRLPFETVRKNIEDTGYKLISTSYKNNAEELRLLCPEKHIYKVNYSDFVYSGARCTKCSLIGTSKAEIELFDTLKVYFTELSKRRFGASALNRPHIKRFELDMFSKPNNRAIEYDGDYHHSEKYLVETKTKTGWPIEDAKNYHPIKDSFFLNHQNIEVLHIKECDWNRDKQACIQLAIAFLSGNCSIYPKPLILPI